MRSFAIVSLIAAVLTVPTTVSANDSSVAQFHARGVSDDQLFQMFQSCEKGNLGNPLIPLSTIVDFVTANIPGLAEDIVQGIVEASGEQNCAVFLNNHQINLYYNPDGHTPRPRVR